MPSRLRTALTGLATAGLLIAGAAATAQEPLIIDAATGQPIQIEGLSSGAMTTLQGGGEIMANTPQGQIVLRGEVYRPGIWTDPDGCQHWVMDDGTEGYMAPILTRSGRPVCGNQPVPQDQFVIRKYDVPYHGKFGS